LNCAEKKRSAFVRQTGVKELRHRAPGVQQIYPSVVGKASGREKGERAIFAGGREAVNYRAVVLRASGVDAPLRVEAVYALLRKRARVNVTSC
jgi:hypothetical protein